MPRDAICRTGVLILAALAVAAADGGEAAPTTVVDDFAYADDAAAQAAWHPMAGTAAVRAARIDGRPALRLPCNFRGTRIERASWDRAVRLDMAGCLGIRFDFLCRDPAPVGQFSLYFQSGEGWYAASFAPQARGWHTVTVEKEATRLEGRPAGWGQIRTLRLSAWRGGDTDTELVVANMRLVGADADVVIVRGDSAAQRTPDEARSVAEYAQSMARMLKDVGLEYATLSDLDLTAARLAGRRLAILPHNPSLPDDAAAVLERWLEGGGRLLVFYALPGNLASVAGIEWKGHLGQTYPGSFASIRFGDQAPAGVPRVVGQRSWNIQHVGPIAGRSRTVANWYDDKGNDTGYPAVVVAQRCIYMTHVLLDDDPAAKQRMLLALLGHLVPQVWSQAVGAALVRAEGEVTETAAKLWAAVAPGAATPSPGPEQMEAAIAALVKAQAQLAEARAQAEAGEFAEAMTGVQDASRLATEAWCLGQAAAPGEHRAFWCHSAFGPAGMTWDESIRLLAENGFTAILPNMLWGGVAYYESAVLPVAPEVKEKGDQVAACAAACKKYGLECHVWKVNWNMGSRTPRDFLERMKRDGRTQVRFDGAANERWLCPSHPENQRLEIESMVEVGTKYDVAGVHFDYIRYPDADGCFCPGCRERFEKAAGRQVANWPKDVRGEATLRDAWLDFRRDQMTRVVAEVHERLGRVRPACKVSAAVFRNWPADRDTVGQDWRLWCERGWLDFVCPMDYTPHNAQLDTWVGQQKTWAGRVPCYPGIGLSVWPNTADIRKLIDQITITRRHKTGGFTIFEYNPTTAREVVPRCGVGITRRN